MKRALVVACLFAACSIPDIDVRWSTDERLTIDGDDATLIFPLTRLGSTARYSLKVENAGMTAVTFEASDGSGVFDWQPIRGLSVDAGSSLPIELSQTPIDDAPQGELVVTARVGEMTRSLRLQLSGEVDHATCEVPEALALGSIVVGAEAEVSFDIANGARLVSLASVSSTASTVVVTPATRSIEAGQHGQFIVRWRPSAEGPFIATLRAKAASECDARPITLTGRAVLAALTWDPASIDYGNVLVGTRVTRTITFHNHTTAVVTLSNIATDSAPFSVSPSTLSIPAEGAASIEVSYMPLAGGQLGAVSFNSDSAAQPSGWISLKGRGDVP